MEDELEDKILYQTYVSHMKIISKIVWGFPLNFSPIAYSNNVWRMLRMYMLKPEIIICGIVIFFIFLYMQAVDIWSRNLSGRLQYTINKKGRSKADKVSFFDSGHAEKCWHMKIRHIAAYAIQGRRPKMEDRFVINDNIYNTGVGLFAVFDGHGGEFAANYAKEKLVQSLFEKVVEIKVLISGKKQIKNSEPSIKEDEKNNDKPKTSTLLDKKKILKKTISTTDEYDKKSIGKEITDPELLNKLNNMSRPITREVKTSKMSICKNVEATDYFDKNGNVNYGKLITDEILAADHSLLEAAKKNFDVAGTTALIAVLEDSKLIVGNVGDSRGVMCDSRGNAIPLSFDHKPQQMRERKRIKEAGGFVTFNGVWRVAGILATSRALGDYPLKDKNFVIADPDILTFELKDHKPMFVILASDGLWDTFTNDEAVSFIKGKLHEPDFGAKSLTLQSFNRGSLDNITVIIINFRERNINN